MGSEANDHDESEAVENETDGAAGKPLKMSKAIRHLEERNEKLLMRVKELELEQEGYELSEESASIVATVKDLHGEVDTAYDLKEAMETDLAATQKKLAEEKALRAQLEARVSLLEEKAAYADELREDISFVEEEQNKTFLRLGEAESELARVTEERDKLAEQKGADQTRIGKLQTERTQLELQVLKLTDRLAEMVSVFSSKRASST